MWGWTQQSLPSRESVTRALSARWFSNFQLFKYVQYFIFKHLILKYVKRFSICNCNNKIEATKQHICFQDLPAAPITDFFEETANFIERALSMRCGLVFIWCDTIIISIVISMMIVIIDQLLHGEQPMRDNRRRLPHDQERLQRHPGPPVHAEQQVDKDDNHHNDFPKKDYDFCWAFLLFIDCVAMSERCNPTLGFFNNWRWRTTSWGKKGKEIKSDKEKEIEFGKERNVTRGI